MIDPSRVNQNDLLKKERSKPARQSREGENGRKTKITKHRLKGSGDASYQKIYFHFLCSPHSSPQIVNNGFPWADFLGSPGRVLSRAPYPSLSLRRYFGKSGGPSCVDFHSDGIFSFLASPFLLPALSFLQRVPGGGAMGRRGRETPQTSSHSTVRPGRPVERGRTIPLLGRRPRTRKPCSARRGASRRRLPRRRNPGRPAKRPGEAVLLEPGRHPELGRRDARVTAGKIRPKAKPCGIRNCAT